MTNQNISTVYGVGMGVTLLSLHATKEDAQKAASLVEPQQIGTDAYDGFSPVYQYAYVVENKPGEVVASEIHPGYGYLKMSDGKCEYTTTIFDYVSLENIQMGNPALARPKSA